MTFLKKYPWILLALLSVVGAAVSLTMLMIAQKNAPEHVTPDPSPAGERVTIPKPD